METRERLAAVAELHLLTSRARELSGSLGRLQSTDKQDQCVAEFRILCDRFDKLHGELQRDFALIANRMKS